MEIDAEGKALSVEEKPEHPKSNYCVTSLYFYPKGVSKKVGEVKAAVRGERKITTLNAIYLREGILKAKVLGRGYA